MTPLPYILLGAGLAVVLYCVGRGLDERGFNRGRRQGYKEGFLAGSQSRQNGYNMGYSHGRYMEAESWARMDAEVESEKLRLECEGEDAD